MHPAAETLDDIRNTICDVRDLLAGIANLWFDNEMLGEKIV